MKRSLVRWRRSQSWPGLAISSSRPYATPVRAMHLSQTSTLMDSASGEQQPSTAGGSHSINMQTLASELAKQQLATATPPPTLLGLPRGLRDIIVDYVLFCTQHPHGYPCSAILPTRLPAVCARLATETRQKYETALRMSYIWFPGNDPATQVPRLSSMSLETSMLRWRQRRSEKSY